MRTGGGGYNEIVICDGKAGEEVRIHAQRDMNTKVRNHRTETIIKNDTYVNREGDRKQTIEKGNDSLTISLGGRATSIPNGEDKTDAKTIVLNGTEKVTLTCGASSIIMEPGKITIKSTVVEVTGAPIKLNL